MAELIDCPGAARSGLNRPSEVGPWLEKDAMPSAPRLPLIVAPTDSVFFAVLPPKPNPPGAGPSFPAEKKIV